MISPDLRTTLDPGLPMSTCIICGEDLDPNQENITLILMKGDSQGPVVAEAHPHCLKDIHKKLRELNKNYWM